MKNSTSEQLEGPYFWGVSRKLIFFVLLVTVCVSTAYFVVQSHLLFDQIITSITGFKSTEGRGFLNDRQSIETPDQYETLARMALEIDTTDTRHNRSTSALVTRTWLRFTSASFGVVLMAFGAVFVLSRVTVDSTSLSGGWERAKVDFTFNSPGLFLVVVGAVLLTIPITSNQDITTDDTSSFFSKAAVIGTMGGDQSEQLSNRMTEFCNRTPKPTGC